MRVVVTGSAGFIGRHLVRRLLAQDILVHEIDKAESYGAQVDITDTDALLKGVDLVAGADCLVHLAAIAAPRYAEAHPAETWATNVAGTHNVLRLAQKAGIPKVVFTSSAHVYGISPRVLPSREDDPLSLLDMYTTSKVMGEKLCELFYANHGISYTTLRLFNGYGPGQSPDYFMGAKIRQAIEGNVTLRGGAVTKDWVHVDDIVEAIVRAMKTAYVGPLNVGTGIETSLMSIAQRVAERFGRDITFEGPDGQGPTRMCADWSRIHRTLGWGPSVPFTDGLDRTIDAYINRRAVQKA